MNVYYKILKELTSRDYESYDAYNFAKENDNRRIFFGWRPFPEHLEYDTQIEKFTDDLIDMFHLDRSTRNRREQSWPTSSQHSCRLKIICVLSCVSWYVRPYFQRKENFLSHFRFCQEVLRMNQLSITICITKDEQFST